MKYDLRNIMKRAWEIKKQDDRNVFSLCLKQAWVEAKSQKGENKVVLEGSEKQVKWAEDIKSKVIKCVQELEEYIKIVDVDDLPYDFYEKTYKIEKVLTNLLYMEDGIKYRGDFYRKKYREEVNPPVAGTDRDLWEDYQSVYTLNNMIMDAKKVIPAKTSAKWWIDHR